MVGLMSIGYINTEEFAYAAVWLTLLGFTTDTLNLTSSSGVSGIVPARVPPGQVNVPLSGMVGAVNVVSLTDDAPKFCVLL